MCSSDLAIAAGMISVLNKADLLPPEVREALQARAARSNESEVVVSAVTGEGCDLLEATLESRIKAGWSKVELVLPPEEGALLSWLYTHGHVLEREDGEEGVRVVVHLDPANRARLDRMRKKGN